MGTKRKVELIVSKDGSHTLFVPELDEHYHSVNGAYNESMHVFIEPGLNSIPKEEIRILEFGFGTGLNAFLTAVYGSPKKIQYHSMEKYPVNTDVLEDLNYKNLFDGKHAMLFEHLHACEWEKDIAISERFVMHKKQCDFKTVELKQQYDLIYFDAFAPEKQPGLWTQEIFKKAYDSLNPGGVLTTYCAKGVVRRMMQDLGFTVERLPGPKGKREMLRAVK